MSEMVFWYKNFRGEEAYRRVRPISLRYGTSEFHHESTWLLLAEDLERGVEREFALKDARDCINSSAVPFAKFVAG